MDPLTLAVILCVGVGLIIEPGWRWHPPAEHARSHLDTRARWSRSLAREHDGHQASTPAHEHHPAPGKDSLTSEKDHSLDEHVALAAHSGPQAAAVKRMRAALASGAPWLHIGTGAGICTLSSLLLCWRLATSSPEADLAPVPLQPLALEDEAAVAAAAVLPPVPGIGDASFPMVAVFAVGAGIGLMMARATHRAISAGGTHRPAAATELPQNPPASQKMLIERTPTIEDIAATDLMEGRASAKSPWDGDPHEPQMPELYAVWTPQVSECSAAARQH
mmetsp:Transcript_115511/g.337911  ORF Transcript_115511/g.337911 Transcript_115511/m.337911 type:complete len:277 (+) Transcript_115511:64-894(+)